MSNQVCSLMFQRMIVTQLVGEMSHCCSQFTVQYYFNIFSCHESLKVLYYKNYHKISRKYSMFLLAQFNNETENKTKLSSRVVTVQPHRGPVTKSARNTGPVHLHFYLQRSMDPFQHSKQDSMGQMSHKS